jgi:hypothetical protein
MSGNDGRTVFKNVLGMQVPVVFKTVDEAYALTREFAARGFVAGDVPVGGYSLPYASAETFDWSLIGARHFTFVKDGAQEQAVERLGEVYTRKDLEAKTKPYKLPPMVKYSRGARESDPVEIRENPTGDNKGYITLIEFVGGGRSIPEFDKGHAANGRRPDAPQPASTQERSAQHYGPQAQRAEPSVDGEPSIEKLLANLEAGPTRSVLAKAKAFKVDDVILAAMIHKITMSPTAPLAQTQYALLMAVIEAEGKVTA